MHLYPIDGAVHRVGKAETAWNCRDATAKHPIVSRFAENIRLSSYLANPLSRNQN
jgi:hypothetical protein